MTAKKYKLVRLKPPPGTPVKQMDPITSLNSQTKDIDPLFHKTFPPEKIQPFNQSLMVGLTVAEACIEHGIDYMELAKCIRKNTNGIRQLIQRALILGKKIHLTRVANGGRGWQASAFVLERKFRAEYGREEKPDGDKKQKQKFRIAGQDIDFN